MRLLIEDVPPSLNKVLRMHWSKKHQLSHDWTMLVRSVLPETYLKPIVRMRVRITLHHAREYDADNAYGACKVLVDALRHWGLIFDDAAEYLSLYIWQEKCPHKKRHTVIELEAV